MNVKKRMKKKLPAIEFVAGTLFFALSLFLHAFCRQANKARFDILYGAYRAHSAGELLFQYLHSALPALGLTALYFLAGGVLIFLRRRMRVKLLATVKGKQLEFDLLNMLRHLMTTAAIVLLLASSIYAVRLPYFRNVAGNVLTGDGQDASGPDILASTQVISHALGAVDGNTYLNCLEGFQEMYAQGVRVFEVDIQFSADASLILIHSWDGGMQDGVRSSTVPTREEFLSKPILGRYTPLSFQDLLLLMAQYPDICIITDTKYSDPSIALPQFTVMLNEAEELGLTHLFDRIIIQFYSWDMLEALERVYHFPHYIFTLYMTGFDSSEEQFRGVAEYCVTHHVEGITMWADWWKPAFASIADEYGAAVYVHTVNNPEQAEELLNTGVSAIYTDFLTDSILGAQGSKVR